MTDQKFAFDEFKLYYESTEKVTDRRLAANSWNYSVSSATLIAVAWVANWGLSNKHFFLVSCIASLVLCSMAILFCSLWVRQITDFKALNNAKFDVLNQMSPFVSFSDSPSDARVSSNPFKLEWDKLKEAEAVGEVFRSGLIALKASNMEYLLPKAFRAVFFIVLLVITTELAVGVRGNLHSIQSLLPVPAFETVPVPSPKT